MAVGTHVGACDAFGSDPTHHKPNDTLALTALVSTVLGVPPWNNAGCSMTSSAQLGVVNPFPVPGGQNVWHPPSKQVRNTC